MRRSIVVAIAVVIVGVVATTSLLLVGGTAPVTTTGTGATPVDAATVDAATVVVGDGEGQALTGAALALFADIRACFDDERRSQMDMFDQAVSCYEPRVVEAAATMTPRDLLDAVEALLAERGDVFTACHNGGHDAAATFTERLWDPSASYEVQIEQMRSIMDGVTGLCAHGYWHGFYQAIGENEPTPDSFRAAADLCVEIDAAATAAGRPGIDCGHGLGHSAWLSTEDFTEAAAICGVFRVDNLRYACDDGVLMYLPDVWTKQWGLTSWAASPIGTSWDPARFYDAAATVCDWWPAQRAGDPTPLAGCWRGIVGGLLFRPMSNLIDSANRDYWSVRDQLTDMLQRAEAVCTRLGPAGAATCFEQWPSYIVYIVPDDADQVRDFCSGLRERRDWCIEVTLQRIDEVTEQGLEVSILNEDDVNQDDVNQDDVTDR